jgi:hypothetical protein
LLPDGEEDTSGHAIISNPTGTTNLDSPYDATTVSANHPPSRAIRLTDADVQSLFGDALSALPPAPQRFTLFFRFESDELTDESRSMVPEILQAFPSFSLSVIRTRRVRPRETTDSLESVPRWSVASSSRPDSMRRPSRSRRTANRTCSFQRQTRHSSHEIAVLTFR